MVLGYSNREARLIENFLREAQLDVEGLISSRLRQFRQRGYSLGRRELSRLTRLNSDLDELLGNIYRESYNETSERLIAFAQQESRFASEMLINTVPIEVGAVLPSSAVLRSAVVSRPFQGSHLREWYGTLQDAQRRNLRQSIRLGVAEGESIEQIVDRVVGTRGAGFADGSLEVGRRQARGVVRTAVNHVSTHAREATYAEHSELIKGVQMVATLDGRTSPFCRNIDGQVFPLSSGTRPPFHFNCRTTTVPIIRSLRELGIGNLGTYSPAARASMNGQVAGSLRYPQWFRSQSAGFQREVLGPKRYQMFSNGLTDITRFADRKGRLYTLSDLYRRESSIAQAANVI